MLTVLPPAGSNTYPVDVVIVLKPVPSELPCRATVWVRASHDGGSFSTTWSIAVAVPRSTWAHCGNAPLALSQYVAAVPSVRLPATYGPLAVLAAAGRPAARLGPPVAAARGIGPADTTRPVASTAVIRRRVSLLLIGYLRLWSRTAGTTGKPPRRPCPAPTGSSTGRSDRLTTQANAARGPRLNARTEAGAGNQPNSPSPSAGCRRR